MLPVVVTLIGNGYISYCCNVLLKDTCHQLEHSLEVNTAIDDPMHALEDAETRQRG